MQPPRNNRHAANSTNAGNIRRATPREARATWDGHCPPHFGPAGNAGPAKRAGGFLFMTVTMLVVVLEAGLAGSGRRRGRAEDQTLRLRLEFADQILELARSAQQALA